MNKIKLFNSFALLFFFLLIVTDTLILSSCVIHKNYELALGMGIIMVVEMFWACYAYGYKK